VTRQVPSRNFSSDTSQRSKTEALITQELAERLEVLHQSPNKNPAEAGFFVFIFFSETKLGSFLLPASGPT
jgi:hypothetical protein